MIEPVCEIKCSWKELQEIYFISISIVIVSFNSPIAHLIIKMPPKIPMIGSSVSIPKNFPIRSAIIAKIEVSASARIWK